jgi:signal transduction histidine kinase
MTTRTLRWLTIVLPVGFVLIILVIRQLVYASPIVWWVELLSLLLILVGSVALSSWVFQQIENREIETQRRTDQLTALNEASLVLTKELDLATVLQTVVDLATQLVNAQYGALGVLSESGHQIEQFLTTGMSQTEKDQMAGLPQGLGLLGELSKIDRPVRSKNILTDDRAVGFPENHPPMTTFLGVPIRLKDRVIGNIYLTDKKRADSTDSISPLMFSDEDEYLLEMFATQAAIAIENAQLYRKTQQLAVLQERERFGMDLHDGIIQSVYAIGLMLEDTQLRMKTDPEVVDERIQRTILGLNELIRDIRNYILDLRPQRFQGKDIKRGLEELARELQANTFLNVVLSVDGFEISPLNPEETVEVLHIVQEALTNIRKHARATNVEVTLHIEDAELSVIIQDDGIGIPETYGAIRIGNGLRNMRERTSVLRGEIVFLPREPKGTKVELRIPVPEV